MLALPLEKAFGISNLGAEFVESDRTGELQPAILLVDMDSFFASVEIKDHPELAGKPVLVGGNGRRGVVASCTYEARRFGIHSAMPMSTALRLCPAAIVLGGNMSRYAAVSKELHRIFVDVTPVVEPLALDEAFLDVTGSTTLLGTPFTIAHSIRQRIRDELDLECAVGVGSSKLIAKLASKEAKPKIVDGRVAPGAGVVAILDEEVRAFLDTLGVRALFGVGPATAQALERLGIERVADLARMDPELLVRHLGRSQAYGLIGLARGEDSRPVVADQVSKSVGHEETYPQDLYDREELEERLRRQSIAVAGALRSSGRRGRTITVKVKDGIFRIRTRSHSLVTGIDDPAAIFEVARALFGGLELDEGVRLLGVSASSLEDATEPVQLRLDVGQAEDAAGERAIDLQLGRIALEDAVAEIRERFGHHVVGSAASLSDEGLRVPVQRAVPFGPVDADVKPKGTDGPEPAS